MDSTGPFNPLTAADYKRIREALAEVDRVKVYLMQLGNLGHAVDGHQTSVEAAEQYLGGVLVTFPEGQ